MLITTFGPPSGYTQFCLFLIRFLAEEVLKDVDHIAADELEQLRTAWTSRKHPHVLFFSHSPERAMVDVFLKLDRPLLILTENADDVAAYVMRERGQAWPWGVRLTHQCLFAISDLMLGTHALVLRRDYELSFREFFQAVSQHFQIDIAPHQLPRIMARGGLGADYSLDDPMERGLLARWEHARPLYAPLEGVTRGEGRIIEQVNAPLKALMAGRSVEKYQWPQEMFIPADTPETPLMGTIEMLGPARCLFYGPYLHLPPGKWDVSVELAVEDNLSGNRMEIQFVQGDMVLSESFDAPKANAFIIRAHLDIEDPRKPIEIRLFMREGAIEGRLELRSATAVATDIAGTKRAPHRQITTRAS